jgi:hypothetical protein
MNRRLVSEAALVPSSSYMLLVLALILTAIARPP